MQQEKTKGYLVFVALPLNVARSLVTKDGELHFPQDFQCLGRFGQGLSKEEFRPWLGALLEAFAAENTFWRECGDYIPVVAVDEQGAKVFETHQAQLVC